MKFNMSQDATHILSVCISFPHRSPDTFWALELRAPFTPPLPLLSPSRVKMEPLTSAAPSNAYTLSHFIPTITRNQASWSSLILKL